MRHHRKPSEADSTLPDVNAFERSYDEQLKHLGRVNVAIVGDTGVGKSTLTNAIFGRVVAETGIGAPVSKGVKKYVNEAGTLALFDCEGFELDSPTSPLTWIRDEIAKNRKGEPSDYIHVVWYCVSAHSRRFTDGQRRLLEALRALDVPVLLVMTQVTGVRGVIQPDHLAFRASLLGMALPTANGTVHLTSALSDPFLGSDVFGLEELVHETSFRVPAAQQAAFIAAQRVSLAAKSKQARAWIASAGAAAAAVGATPIPGADAPVLVSIQFGLMTKIAAIYGISKRQAARIASGAGVLATTGGRQLVASLTKLIPGAGSILTASVASSLTLAMGEAWRVVCERVYRGELSYDSVGASSQLSAAFASVFKQTLKVKKVKAR